MSKSQDLKEKKELLSDIEDEVKDFHPLLLNLFIKIPRVIRVEHTHGPDENGADIVVIRRDDMLLTNEYIGVIVKLGKIHQDLSRIREQIEECKLERLINNGKEKIRLDEIWVVTNEHITAGAKRKIHDSFSSRKIRFLQNTDIIRLIDETLENYWNQIPLGTSDYLAILNTKIQRLENSTSLIPNTSEDLYIKQDIEEFDVKLQYDKDSNKAPKKIQFEDLVDIVTENEVTFIEGKPGYGKTRLLRYTVNHFCEPITFIKHKQYPVYATYREIIDDYNGNINKLLEDSVYKLSEFDTDSNVLIFIDGFDEKLLIEDNEIEELESLIDSLKEIDNCRAVITSRPINYIDSKRLQNLNIKWYELCPLTIAKLVEFFGNLCKSNMISTRILNDISKSNLFKQLPRSPIAAILLANLLKENSKDLPSSLTELYSKYCELMLGRWDIKKGLQSEREYGAARSIIMNIAKFFIENDLDYMAIDEVKNFFLEYLDPRNLGIDADDLFNKLTNRSGIIQKEEMSNRVYFKHRTFAEYFFASYSQQNTPLDLTPDRIYNYYWRNIYFFYIGLLTDCEDVLNKVIEKEPKEALYRFTRIINMADYLLAGYASPYKVVSDGVTRIFVEAARLYNDVVNNRIETPLQTMSVLGNLYLFKSIFRHAYAYEFFYPAIEDSIVEVLSDGHIDEDDKMYAIFFMSVVLIELGKDNPFDGLIENFSSKLPFPLLFGISYESEDISTHSLILKKQEKRLTKIIKRGSRKLQNYIDMIHSEPIHDSEEDTSS